MNIKVLWHLLTTYLATSSRAHQIEVDVFNNQVVHSSLTHNMNLSPDKIDMRDLLETKVIKPNSVSKKQKRLIVELFLEIAQSNQEEYCQLLLFLLDPETKIQLHAGRIKEIHKGASCGFACFESLTSCLHLPTDLGLSDYDYFKSVMKHELEHATDWLNNKYNGVNTHSTTTLHRTYTNRYNLVLDEKGIHNASLESADRANAKIKIELQKTKGLFDRDKPNAKTEVRYHSIKVCVKKSYKKRVTNRSFMPCR